MADDRNYNSVDRPFNDNDNEPVKQVSNCVLCQCHQSRGSFEQRSDSFHRRDRLYEMEERSHELLEIQHYYRTGGNGRGRYKQLQLAIEKMMVVSLFVCLVLQVTLFTQLLLPVTKLYVI